MICGTGTRVPLLRLLALLRVLRLKGLSGDLPVDGRASLVCTIRLSFGGLLSKLWRLSAGVHCSFVATSPPRSVQSASILSSGFHNRLSGDEPHCSTQWISRESGALVDCHLRVCRCSLRHVLHGITTMAPLPCATSSSRVECLAHCMLHSWCSVVSVL